MCDGTSDCADGADEKTCCEFFIQTILLQYYRIFEFKLNYLKLTTYVQVLAAKQDVGRLLTEAFAHARKDINWIIILKELVQVCLF